MRQLPLTLAAVLLLTSMDGHADLVFSSDRDAFFAENTLLVIEDFEEVKVGGGLTGPLDATTNNDIFQPGDIVEGLTVSASPAQVQDEEQKAGSSSLAEKTEVSART